MQGAREARRGPTACRRLARAGGGGAGAGEQRRGVAGAVSCPRGVWPWERRGPGAPSLGSGSDGLCAGGGGRRPPAGVYPSVRRAGETREGARPTLSCFPEIERPGGDALAAEWP